MNSQRVVIVFIVFVLFNQFLFGQSSFGVGDFGCPGEVNQPRPAGHWQSLDHNTSNWLSGNEDRKWVLGAALLSLAVPGAGQWYASDKQSALIFLGTEATLWLGYAAVDAYGRWTQTGARMFAVQHAGIDPVGKSDQFFVDIGNFMSVYDYNEKKLRDRALSKVYDPSQGYFWQWDNVGSRSSYRSMRVTADAAFNATKFIIAGIIVNHIVSAIHAGNRAAKWNASIEISSVTGAGGRGQASSIAFLNHRFVSLQLRFAF
ncbi:MAG: hypothetical protein ACP5JH_00925 [Bacteroidota bacterium]